MSKEEIISSLREIIARHRAHITEAWLFGSFAGNEYHRTSDIDIAISCDDWREWLNICDEINDIETIRRFDIINMRDQELVFDPEVIRSGIKIY